MATQLSEKSRADCETFVATLSTNDRVSIFWFDSARPGGRVWTGTVVSIAADKKSCSIRYEVPGVENPGTLDFPNNDVKVHDFQRLQRGSYAALAAAAEGQSLGARGTVKLSPWDICSYRQYYLVTGLSVEGAAERLTSCEMWLRSIVGLHIDSSRVNPEIKDGMDCRLSDICTAIISFVAFLQDQGADWITKPSLVATADQLTYCLAAQYVAKKGKSVKCLAELAERHGLRGTAGKSLADHVTSALSKKSGEGADGK